MKILVQLALAPFLGFYYAWCYSTIWGLFLLKQYGPGPSYSAWYGIGVIFNLMTFTFKREGIFQDEDSMTQTLFKQAFLAFVILASVGLAWATTLIFGW